jgi:3-oxoadipate enol-lactonase
MKFFFEENLFLEYSFEPCEGKETILFLNGLTQSYDVWNSCTTIIKNNYQILKVDLINQGNSSFKDCALDFNDHATIIQKLVVHLGLEQIWISGISYGSIVAQHFACLFPDQVKGIILISSFARKTNYYKAVEKRWEKALSQNGYQYFVETILPYVLGKTYFENPNVSIEKIIAQRISKPVNEQALKLLMQATANRKDFTKELKKLDCSVLIIHGEEDLLFPLNMAFHLAATLNNSTMVVFPKTGHSINLEQPEKLAHTIDEYIVTETNYNKS